MLYLLEINLFNHFLLLILSTYLYFILSYFILFYIFILMSEIDSNITSSEKLDSKNNNKIGNPAPTNKLENQAKPEVVQQVPDTRLILWTDKRKSWGLRILRIKKVGRKERGTKARKIQKEEAK